MAFYGNGDVSEAVRRKYIFIYCVDDLQDLGLGMDGVFIRCRTEIWMYRVLFSLLFFCLLFASCLLYEHFGVAVFLAHPQHLTRVRRSGSSIKPSSNSPSYQYFLHIESMHPPPLFYSPSHMLSSKRILTTAPTHTQIHTRILSKPIHSPSQTLLHTTSRSH